MLQHASKAGRKPCAVERAHILSLVGNRSSSFVLALWDIAKMVCWVCSIPGSSKCRASGEIGRFGGMGDMARDALRFQGLQTQTQMRESNLR